MTVWLANYNVATNSTPYVQQRDYIMDAVKTYGTANIGGIAVGNEFILEYVASSIIFSSLPCLLPITDVIDEG